MVRIHCDLCGEEIKNVLDHYRLTLQHVPTGALVAQDLCKDCTGKNLKPLEERIKQIETSQQGEHI